MLNRENAMLRQNGHRTERVPETDGSDRGPRIAARDIVKTYDTGRTKVSASGGADLAVGGASAQHRA